MLFRSEVLIGGRNVRDYPLEGLRAKIGIVMQKAVLFHGTVRENLRWGIVDGTDTADGIDRVKEQTGGLGGVKGAGINGELSGAQTPGEDERMWEALEIAQAKEFIEKKEGGLDFEIEQGGKNLSGGQRQRMTIARAVVRKPEILILDDSASALDFATDAALRKAIRNASDDMTVFIVSQRAASIMYADKILVLDDGRIAGAGTHQELLRSCEVYQEIYYSQFEREEGA